VGWKNTVLWVLQWAFGIYFVLVGVMHFVVPDGLPSAMEWMYELSDTTHIVVGIAEVLGGLGLILPSVTRIRPELTVYAAVGLVLGDDEVDSDSVTLKAMQGNGGQATVAADELVTALRELISEQRK